MLVYVDSIAPVGIRCVVKRAPGSTRDMSAIASAIIAIQKPKLSNDPDEPIVTTTWAVDSWVIISPEEIHLIHAFVTGDVDRIGEYRVAPNLTFSDGVVPCEARALPVVSRFTIPT